MLIDVLQSTTLQVDERGRRNMGQPRNIRFPDDLEEAIEAARVEDGREIPASAIRVNPAAQLAAGHRRPTSAANGAKGGRPRKQP